MILNSNFILVFASALRIKIERKHEQGNFTISMPVEQMDRSIPGLTHTYRRTPESQTRDSRSTVESYSSQSNWLGRPQHKHRLAQPETEKNPWSWEATAQGNLLISWMLIGWMVLSLFVLSPNQAHLKTQIRIFNGACLSNKIWYSVNSNICNMLVYQIIQGKEN